MKAKEVNSGGELEERIPRNDVRSAAIGMRWENYKFKDRYFKKSHYFKKILTQPLSRQ